MLKMFIISVALVCIYSTAAFGAGNDLFFVGLYKTNFVVTDPLGRSTGFDPISNQRLTAIPNSSYVESGFGGPEEPQPDNYMELQIKDAMDGIYKIKVIGNKLGYTTFIVDYPHPLGTFGIPAMKTVSDINKVDYYEFAYNYSAGLAGQRLSFIRVVNPSNLIEDIKVLYKLSYIGNQEFVNELIKKIQKIEKEGAEVSSAEDQKPEEKKKEQEKEDHEPATPAQRAIKKYQKLLNEITEHYQKPEADEFVREEAYTVLKEDLEYIISHIQ